MRELFLVSETTLRIEEYEDRVWAMKSAALVEGNAGYT